MMRRRGPGLIRAAATTAVVAGTATAVSGRVARRQDRRYMQEDYAQQQQAYAQQPQAYPQQPYQPVADEPDYTDEIARLARLRAQNLITEDEFDAKKKQILGI